MSNIYLLAKFIKKQKRGGFMMSLALGRKIKGYRRLKRFTQSQLASRVDISVSQLSVIERGVRSPRPELLDKIVDVLGIQREELLIAEDNN